MEPVNDLTVERITTELRTLISEIIEVPEDQIKEDVPFETLGVDSLIALEIIASVEKKYRIHIPEEQLEQVKSFRDTIALVTGHFVR